MTFHSIPLDQVDIAAIDGLIGEDETSRLDFKAQLPDTSKEQEKVVEVADICALWRSGGDIVYGIRDEDGTAVEVCGLGEADLDEAQRKLDQLAESRIVPRLPSIEFKPIPDHPNGPVLVLRIARSWQGPHAVRVNEGFRFPIRGASARNAYLDFEQVRSEFAGGEELLERIRAFRDRRLAAILTGGAVVPVFSGAKTVTHVIPVSAWLERREVDPRPLQHHSAFVPHPRGAGGGQGRYQMPNLDGFVTFDEWPNEEGAVRYLQAFRDGAFERVNHQLFSREHPHNDYGAKTAFGGPFERELIAGVAEILELLRSLDLAPPVVVLPSIVGGQGWVIASGRIPGDLDAELLRLPSDLIRLPDLVVDEFSDTDELARVLRPVIDVFWQASGWRGSPFYDEEGNWQPHDVLRRRLT